MNQDKAESEQSPDPSSAALDEGQRLRRLQFMMNLVMQVIAQDSRLTVEEASPPWPCFRARNWPTICSIGPAFNG